MANSAVIFGALVGVVAFLVSFSLHKIEEGMVPSGASCEGKCAQPINQKVGNTNLLDKPATWLHFVHETSPGHPSTSDEAWY